MIRAFVAPTERAIVVTPRRAVAASDPETPGVVARVLGLIQRLACGLHGHDAVLQYERRRMFLRCMSCGYETPGWDVPVTVRRGSR